MKLFGLTILGRRALRDIKDKERASGFEDCVESLVAAIRESDKVILGNGVAFVGAVMKDSYLSMVGNNQTVMNSAFLTGKKGRDKYDCQVRIGKTLE